MRISRRTTFDWLLPLLWMLVIFSASSDTGSAQHTSRIFLPLMHWLFPHMADVRIEFFHFLFRKCGHLTEFAVFGLLLWRAIRHASADGHPPWQWSQAGLALLLVMIFAASDEFHQTFVPGRTGQVSDVFIDTSGAVVGLGLLWLGGKLLKRW